MRDAHTFRRILASAPVVQPAQGHTPTPSQQLASYVAHRIVHDVIETHRGVLVISLLSRGFKDGIGRLVFLVHPFDDNARPPRTLERYVRSIYRDFAKLLNPKRALSEAQIHAAADDYAQAYMLLAKYVASKHAGSPEKHMRAVYYIERWGSTLLVDVDAKPTQMAIQLAKSAIGTTRFRRIRNWSVVLSSPAFLGSGPLGWFMSCLSLLILALPFALVDRLAADRRLRTFV